MCGLSVIISRECLNSIEKHIEVMNSLQKHRGPDDSGIFIDRENGFALGHNRLSIIDISGGKQPMRSSSGNYIVYNGELYNYLELKKKLKFYSFKTSSDTEVILASYEKWGQDCVQHFRGMFSFVIWDCKNRLFFGARDHFGIKPLYFHKNDSSIYFASEAKAILPFLNNIDTNLDALQEYLTFQFVLGSKTLFKNIEMVLPGHSFQIKNNKITFKKYWENYFNIDRDHTKKYFIEKLRETLEYSFKIHTRSDTPIGSYLSGGIDSSCVTILANQHVNNISTFTGRFNLGSKYDESYFAKLVTQQHQLPSNIIDITHHDFANEIYNVIYHLDYPMAGPGSFSQYMVSKYASQSKKVMLSGLGGDEIFGGYIRYLIAYFEQCVKYTIDEKNIDSNYIITYNSIAPNLSLLKDYKPMLKKFWSDGLFEDMDKRYYKLIIRDSEKHIIPGFFRDRNPYDEYLKIFKGDNVKKASYLDSMMNFDSKTLLPALLHVEDRVSMAHGIESRVPILDIELVKIAATIPSDMKFGNGDIKHIFRKVLKNIVPDEILDRKSKMGFPTPFSAWSQNVLNDFIINTLMLGKGKRDYINYTSVIKNIKKQAEFDRSIWGILSLEIWQQLFHDQGYTYRQMLK